VLPEDYLPQKISPVRTRGAYVSPPRTSDKGTLSKRVLEALKKQLNFDNKKKPAPVGRPKKQAPEVCKTSAYYADKHPIAKRKRGFAHPTEEVKNCIAMEYQNLGKPGKGIDGAKWCTSVNQVATKYNVHRITVLKYSKNFTANKTLRKKPMQQPKRVMTKKIEIATNKIVDDNPNDTWDEIAEKLTDKSGLKIHRTTIAKFMKAGGLRTFKVKFKSLLSKKQRASRLAFAIEHKDDAMDDVVHLDEKYFDIASSRRTEKRRQGATPKPKTFSSRRFPPKAFFLTAVAKPNKKYNFNGKIGCWRVCTLKTAKKKSVNHAKGDVYEVDCNMDAEKYAELIIQVVIPAARKKMHWLKTIKFQEDNATPHSSALYKPGIDEAMRKNGIVSMAQPPQSPDCNVLDLSVFSALQAGVDKLTPSMRKNNQSVADATYQAWTNYSAGSLALAFETRSVILHCIEYHKGGNGFKIPHVGIRSELKEHIKQINEMLETDDCKDTPESLAAAARGSKKGKLPKAQSWQSKPAPSAPSDHGGTSGVKRGRPQGAKNIELEKKEDSDSDSDRLFRLPSNIRRDTNGRGKARKK